MGGAVVFFTAKESLQTEEFKKLTAVRESKANQVEHYFSNIKNQIISYSESTMLLEATKAFEKVFFDLDIKKLDKNQLKKYL